MRKLSVIIITWNSGRYVSNCLSSLWNALKGIDCEVVFVDNGSSDNTRSVLESYDCYDNVRYFPLPENLGVAKARNIGIKAAEGEYVWLLDIDTEVTSAAVTGMLSFMDSNPECGICGCKLLNFDGMVQDSCRKFPTLRYKILNVLEVMATKLRLPSFVKSFLSKQNSSQFYHGQMNGNDSFEVEYLIGACQMIRRKVINDIGLLDENIFYGPEDADYCHRASLTGWKICYLPSLSFLHDYQKITNRKLISRMSWLHTKALFYYFWKYRER